MRSAIVIMAIGLGCGDDGRRDVSATAAATATDATVTTTATTTVAPTSSTTAMTDEPTTGPSTTGPTSEDTTATTAATATTSPVGCGACSEPNQTCVDDVCVTSCLGQDPDPCGPAQVCDVLSGTCREPDAACSLAGATEACGAAHCGPGTVCDGVDACLPIAPCSGVACTSEGDCWGTACTCERGETCDDPSAELLNGTFSLDIVGIDFADDCTAWAVTVSGGKEFLRRLTPAGDLVTWGGIGDYDQGEVRVLRSLTIPQLHQVPPLADPQAPPPGEVEGLGEVALTYICCPTCGSCASNPLARGVARLDEANVDMPLPIVIYAEPTEGTGPFGEFHLDAGPAGLTWGEDRVLYVGNTTANGDYNTADLEQGTVDIVYSFNARVTASAPVSPVHVLVALIGGGLHRLNTATKQAEFVVDLMSDVTSLSQDPLTGHVYAALASLDVVRVHPFSGEVADFAKMPAKGRVAVSPSGKLWFTPVKYLNAGVLSAWDLPAAF